MKVLFVTRNFPPVVCGVGDYTNRLIDKFVEDGHRVSVLTTRAAVTVNHPNVIPSHINKWNLFTIPAILNACAFVKPDYISFQYVPYSFDKRGMPLWVVFLYLCLRIKKYNVITTFHEVGIRYTKNNIKKTITSISQFFIAYCIAKLSYKNITSMDLYMGYLKKYSNEVYKIPIGANILPLPVNEDYLHGLKKTVAPNNEFIFSTFGTRISDTLLHALAALKEENHKAKLLLLGNIPSKTRDHFRALANKLNISQDIYITGYLAEAELFAWLKVSSLFVQSEFVSATGEGGICTKSGSLAAAFAAGLPILGTKGDTTDAIFKDNENIFLINNDSDISIKNKIIEIMYDKEKLNIISTNAILTYSNFFSWEKIYQQYAEVFFSYKL